MNYNEIQEKIRDKNLEMKKTVEEITRMSTIVEPKRKINIVKDDSDDNKVIECALEGEADYIITKDNHLLNIKEFEGIKIISPDEFIKKIQSFEE